MRITHWKTDKRKRYRRHIWHVWSSNNNPNDPTDEKDHGGLTLEFGFLKKGHGFGFRFLADTAEMRLSLFFGNALQVYVSVESWAHLRRFTERIIGKEYPRDRELSVWAHDHLVSVTLWRPANHSRRGDRRQILWNWHAALFGRVQTARTETRRVSTTVLMPEGTYGAEVILYDVTHSWKRFKRTKTFHSGEIKVEGGIAHPGKGENSWDLDDDATFSLSMGVSTDDPVSELVGALVESVNRNRLRYGGPNWTPKTQETR